MAKITPYQQGQLASSLVGTPGVNLSASNFLETAGTELNNLGAAQHQQYLTDLRAKQAEQRALQRHMDEMARQTKVINIASGAQVDQQKLMNDLQVKYRDNPAQAIQEYNDQSTPRMQATLAQETDPETNMMLQQKLAQQHASNLEHLGNWQREQQVPLAERQLAISGGSLSATIGQMGNSSPQEIKAKIDQYNNDTHAQYQFYHKHGLNGQFENSSNAVTSYLKATALVAGMTQNPKLLDDRIKEFMGGQYISQDDLLSVYGQQKGIAASVATAQNQQKAQDDWAAFMKVHQQLIIAGNGDPSAAPPAIAQKIHEDSAAKLSPSHNVEIGDMIARNTVAANQREASEKALDLLLNASPTGKLENTPQAAIKQALQIPGLSPEDKERYTKLLTGNVAAVKSQDIDKQVATQVAGSARGAERLSEEIRGDLVSLGRIHNPQQHSVALQQLEIKLKRYNDSYNSLLSSQKSIKDPHVAELVQLQAKNIGHGFDKLIGLLQNDPAAIAIDKSSDSLYRQLTPKSIYPNDSRQQMYYNYLHKQLYYNFISTRKFTAKDLETLQNNPDAIKAMQTHLSKDTAAWMHQRGLDF